MGYLTEGRVSAAFEPFHAIEQALGFLPNLYRAQTLLPRVIEAEAEIAAAVVLKESALARIQKECILLAVAAAKENVYCVTAHEHVLGSLGMPASRLDRILSDYHDADLSTADTALLDFALKLSGLPTWIGREDVDRLRGQGFTDEAILEAVLVTSLSEFLCTLSVGLGADPDFEPRPRPRRPEAASDDPGLGRSREHPHEKRGPHLRSVEMSPEGFAPFAFFKERFGFVPNIFRAQTLRPDVLAAEANAVGTVLLREDVLSRVQKERILLVVSAANLNTYCVAVHVEMLRRLGIPEDLSDQLAVDHHLTDLTAPEKALLDFALKLARRPATFSRPDIEALRRRGFTDEQILEAVVMTALTMFLNNLQMGLGVVPDFEPARIFSRQGSQPAEGPANLSEGVARPMARGGSAPEAPADPDAPLVGRAQGGDLEAFEELVRRHQQRVYRTLMGLIGRREDAEDALQTVFLKAFGNIGTFRGASRFSTWLTRIAINVAKEGLRSRKGVESLDVEEEGAEMPRPRHLRAWVEQAERRYSREQTRQLVEEALLELPPKYRVAVLLRDIEQLTTEEAAAVLGMNPATLKTRLLRGRLLLRDALAPHFMRRGRGDRA